MVLSRFYFIEKVEVAGDGKFEDDAVPGPFHCMRVIPQTL
jgi:hypothetical protein